MALSTDDVLAAVRATDWGQYAVPAVNYLWDYDPARVIPAFDELVSLSSESELWRVNHQLLSSIAHDHSGTPSPAMVPAVRHLVDLVPLLRGWSLACALQVLVDAYLFASGITDFTTTDGRVHDLTVTQPVIASLEPLLHRLTTQSGSPAAGPARELLTTLEELPPGSWTPPEAEGVQILWVNDWWDGPIDGLALYGGQRMWFDTAWDDEADDWSHPRVHRLRRLTAEELAREEEEHRDFERRVGTHWCTHDIPAGTPSAGDGTAAAFYEKHTRALRSNYEDHRVIATFTDWTSASSSTGRAPRPSGAPT